MKILNKKIPTILDKEYSYKEICDSLDEQESRYLSWKTKTHSLEEVWGNVVNRKNTFLTSKK